MVKIGRISITRKGIKIEPKTVTLKAGDSSRLETGSTYKAPSTPTTVKVTPSTPQKGSATITVAESKTLTPSRGGKAPLVTVASDSTKSMGVGSTLTSIPTKELVATKLEDTKIPTKTQATVESAKIAAMNIQTATRQLFTGKQQPYQDITSPFKQRQALKQEYGQYFESPQPYYFGDKQITFGTETTPTFGGKGTSITTFGKVEDIKPNYEISLLKKGEQYILPPMSKIALTGQEEFVYLPTKADAEEFKSILSLDDVKSYNKFVADKQAEYKRDIGRYNLLAAMANEKGELPEDLYKEATKLSTKLSSAPQGTLKEIVYTATETTDKGKALRGGLTFFGTAYQVEKEVLPFTLGIGAITTGARASSLLAKGTKVLSVLDKPFRATVVPLGLTTMGSAGYREYKFKGNITDAFYAGAGAGVGFFSSIYPSKTIRGLGKLGKGTKNVILKLGSTGFEQPKLIRGKKGSTQMFGGQAAESEYEIVNGKFVKKKTRQLFRDFVESTIDTKTFDGGKEIVVKRLPTNQEKLDRLRKLFKEIDKSNPEKVKRFIELSRSELGDDIVKEFILQEGIGGYQTIPQKPKVVSPIERPRISGKIGDQRGRIISDRARIKQEGRLLDRDFITGRTLMGFKSMNKELEKEDVRLLNMLNSSMLLESDQATQTLQATKQIQQQVQKPSDEQIAGFSFFGERNYDRRFGERPIGEFKPFGFPDIDLPNKKKKKGFIASSFDAQVRIDATKERKARWETIANNVPLITALSKGAQVTDESASNRFRVVPQKGKARQLIDTSWEALQGKFREYTQKGGVKIGLRPRNYIEKRSARIDSPGERRAIPQAGRASIGRKFGRL